MVSFSVQCFKFIPLCWPCLLALTIREEITAFLFKINIERSGQSLQPAQHLGHYSCSCQLSFSSLHALPHRILGDVEIGDKKRLLSCRTAVSAVPV